MSRQASFSGSFQKKKSQLDYFVVASIDFGTTFSGTAFAFKHDPMEIHAHTQPGARQVSLKAPTCILIKRDDLTVNCFGYDAEQKYERLTAEGEHINWLYFRHFKMMLHKGKNFKEDTQLDDFTGKKLSATKVFSLSITYLKDGLLRNINATLSESIKQEEIRWVITVPAIWNDSAKQFMRRAAEQAGIDGNRLDIALEPEAASLYCRKLRVERGFVDGGDTLVTLPPGSIYLVLDAGGGTVDITVHKTMTNGTIREVHHATGGDWGGTNVDRAFIETLTDIFGGTVDITVHKTMTNGTIREVHHATGGDWGGTNVDRAFIETLTDIFGKETMNALKQKHTEDYYGILMDFERKKRDINPSMTTEVKFRIPLALIERHQEIKGTDIKEAISSSPYRDKVIYTGDKIRFNPEVMRSLFSQSINSITGHVASLLREETVRECSTILLVGGYSESGMLQEAIKESFPYQRVIIPEEAGLAVLKGAVLYGFTPEAITERICKSTYGKSTSHVTMASCSHPPCPTFYDDEDIMFCDDIFSVHVKKGQAVRFGETQEEMHYHSIFDHPKTVKIQMFTSTERIPSLVTDQGCRAIGHFIVPITGGKKGEFGVSFVFGGTELEVIARDKRSQTVTKHHIDLDD